MAENKSKASTNKNNENTEDPEEVAAREAGEQAPAIEEVNSDVVDANAEAEEEARTDEDGEEVDPGVHVPRVEQARKV